MHIVYDNVFCAEKTAMSDPVDMLVSARGVFSISLSTSDFKIEYVDGKASVSLHKHITSDQARKLAEAIIKKADEQDAQKTAITQMVCGGLITQTIDPESGHVMVTSSRCVDPDQK